MSEGTHEWPDALWSARERSTPDVPSSLPASDVADVAAEAAESLERPKGRPERLRMVTCSLKRKVLRPAYAVRGTVAWRVDAIVWTGAFSVAARTLWR